MPTDVLTKEQVKDKIDRGEDIYIIDARDEDVYTGGNNQIQGAIHLTENIAREVYDQLPKEREYMVYSTHGEDEISLKLANFLREKGYTAYVIKGGYEEWRDSGLPIEPINAKGTPLL